MNVSLLTAVLHTDRPVRGPASLLRGFFANHAPENVLMHQHFGHDAEHRYVYLYPRVQYRIANGVARLLGIEEGVSAIMDAVADLGYLDLAGCKYGIREIELLEGQAPLQDTSEPMLYQFNKPWLALSQKNYRRYCDADPHEQDVLLQRTLIGNILSMCKSLDFRVTETLNVGFRLRRVSVFVKKQKMLGFLGRFAANFQFVPGLGLGHLVSIGYGELAPCEQHVTADQRAL